MAIAGTASIAFMNWNLSTNSVGLYQMSKLMCIPYMVIVSRITQSKKTSLDTLFALFLILTGVGVSTVTGTLLQFCFYL
jgi:solute carrier family 35 protein E3